MLLRLLTAWTNASLRRLGARPFTATVGPHRITGYEAGPADGEPWLLLHGLGATSAAWVPVIAALRNECRLVVPELSSLGGSICPNHGLNAREGADVASELIRTRLGGTATVAGMSLGGWMGTLLSLERPEEVDRLLIVNGAGFIDQDWDRIREVVSVESLADIDPLYETLFHRVPWILRLSRRGFYAAYSSPGVRHVIASTDESHGFSADDLSRIDLPVGLVWGEHDRLFELEVGQAMRRALPRSELRVIAGSGHGVHWERPRALVAAIQGLRRIP